MSEIVLEPVPGKIEILKNGNHHEKEEVLEKKEVTVEESIEPTENNHIDEAEAEKKPINSETCSAAAPQQNSNNKNTGKNKKNKKKNAKTNSQEADGTVNEETALKV
jgi:hypothetical protein